MLNVFIAIIPLLLLSAAFTQISVIQASLPADAIETPPADDEPLGLTVVILSEAYVTRGRGLTTAAIPRGSRSGSSRSSAPRWCTTRSTARSRSTARRG